jgi:hypothetical protein
MSQYILVQTTHRFYTVQVTQLAIGYVQYMLQLRLYLRLLEPITSPRKNLHLYLGKLATIRSMRSTFTTDITTFITRSYLGVFHKVTVGG